jgi:putative membrane protein
VHEPEKEDGALPRVDVDQMRRTSMAAERTWLAWWRSALAATVGALAVGRFAPDLLDVPTWPYVVVGCGYAALAIGLLLTGARRRRELEASLYSDEHRPLSDALVMVFTAGGVLIALATIALVLAQA